MNHADVNHYLADYLEGELSLDTRALVDAHLDACVACAGEVDEMQRTIRLLRMLPDPQPPPMIASDVMRRIRAGETRPNFFGKIGKFFGGALEPGFVLPASAVAVAALVVVVVQDPSSLSRLGLGPAPEAADNVLAVSPIMPDIMPDMPEFMPGFLLQPPPRFAGAESEAGRVFGAPAIQDFGFALAPRDQVTRSLRQLDSASRMAAAESRFRIELEPAARRRSILFSNPSLAPRLPNSLRAQPSGVLDGRLRVAKGWAPSSNGLALPVAQPRWVRPGGLGVSAESSGGGDKRDEWIARGLEDPRGFARYIASQNLAEQELWVARLSERAEARGSLEDLVRVLRESGDVVAAVVAEDFAAESDRLRAVQDSSASAR